MHGFAVHIGPVGAQVSPVAIAVIGVLLLAFTQATRRAMHRLQNASLLRRRSVFILNVLAFFAMALLLIPLSADRPATQHVSLATEGAPELPVGKPTYRLHPSNSGNDGRPPTLSKAGELILLHPALQTLEVTGHGLDAADWAALPRSWEVAWNAPPLAGPVDLRWRSVIGYGEALSITGVLRLDEEARGELRLLDPAGVVVDTVMPAAHEPFNMRTLPRSPGLIVYRLQLVLGGNVVQDEPVALHVREYPPLRLLVLQSAPSFETRHLASWAAGRGGKLLINSQISRDRELLQRVNLPADSPATLTEELLAATDLAVIDGRRWAGLDTARRQQVLQAVRDGLGVFLLADKDLASWLQDPQHTALLGLSLSPDTDMEAGLPTGLDQPSPLPLAPWRLVLNGAQSLSRGEQGEPLEAWTRLGQGRIAVSRLRERHRWATSGNASTFARYWSRVLATLGRAQTRARWLAPDRLPQLRTGQRARFCASAGPEQKLRLRLEPLDAAVDEGPIAEALRMEAHRSGSPLACGYAWPIVSGWHALYLIDERDSVIDTIRLRVSDAGEWRSDRFDRRQRATAERAGLAGQTSPAVVAQRVSAAWICLALLLTLALLWTERRLFELDAPGQGTPARQQSRP